ncbi:ANK2, partial [Symbiodinium sp. CCMP2592]
MRRVAESGTVALLVSLGALAVADASRVYASGLSTAGEQEQAVEANEETATAATTSLPTTTTKTGMPLTSDSLEIIEAKRAVLSGNLAVLEKLRQAGYDLFTVGRISYLPAFAAANGKVAALRYLHEAGANFSRRDHDGHTPAHVAALHNQVEALAVLQEAGVDLNSVTDHNGGLPVHAAAENPERETDALIFLIQAGVNVSFVNGRGETPAFLAAHRCNDKALEVLAKARADLQTADNRGNTPLHVAAGSFGDRPSRANALRILIQAGVNLNAVNKDGDTPLCMAGNKRQDEATEVLVKAGANVNAINKHGETPAFMAVIFRRDKALELLAKAGADLQITPASTAVIFRRYLVKAGADLQTAEKNGNTLLHAALTTNVMGNPDDEPSRWRVPILRTLIQVGANVNATNEYGVTPAYMAAFYGQDKTLEVLAKAGAGLDIADNVGNTPLHAASRQRGKVEVVSVLIQAGANVNAINEKGETPAYMAADFCRDKTLELLLKVGAGISLLK